MWRGFTIDQFMNQCFSNSSDDSKGRQIPTHYGSVELNFVTISSPIATQMPQGLDRPVVHKNGGPLSVCLSLLNSRFRSLVLNLLA